MADKKHPDGPLISLTAKERADLKAKREAKGFTTRELAARAGTTQGTISNVETGRHPQVRRGVYARIRRALRDQSPAAADADHVFKEIVEDAVDLTPEQLVLVRGLVKTVKAPG
jgi:transcriptional regulator with XRE-family HTH domain